MSSSGEELCSGRGGGCIDGRSCSRTRGRMAGLQPKRVGGAPAARGSRAAHGLRCAERRLRRRPRGAAAIEQRRHSVRDTRRPFDHGARPIEQAFDWYCWATATQRGVEDWYAGLRDEVVERLSQSPAQPQFGHALCAAREALRDIGRAALHIIRPRTADRYRSSAISLTASGNLRAPQSLQRRSSSEHERGDRDEAVEQLALLRVCVCAQKKRDDRYDEEHDWKRQLDAGSLSKIELHRQIVARSMRSVVSTFDSAP